MNEKFNPASATRAMFTEAINRALNDMTDAQVEDLCRSMVGTEMSQRQLADLQIESTFNAAIATIRSEMTQKAGTDSLIAESEARYNGDTTLSGRITAETAARETADDALSDAVAVVANAGAKNCLKITGSSQTIRDVDFVVSDNGITVSGTSSQASNAFLIGTFTPDRSGRYTVTSGLTGASSSGYYVQMRAGASSSSPYVDRIYTEPVTVDLTAGTVYGVRFYFPSGITISDVCRPMIQPAEITDTDFVPYAPTNRELYEMILALQNPASPSLSLQSFSRPEITLDNPEVTEDA